MKKTAVIRLAVAGTVLLSPMAAYAETNSDRLKEIRSQIQERNYELDKKTEEKQQLEQHIANMQTEVDELNRAIQVNEAELKALQDEIAATAAIIEEKNERIQELQKKIEQRQALMNARLQSLQEQPRTNMILEVLLEAKNLSDILSRFYSISMILDSDSTILEEQARDQDELEKEQRVVMQREQDLQESRAREVLKQQELDTKKEKLAVKLQTLHNELSTVESELESIEEAAQLLAAQEQAIQRLMEEEARAAQQARTTPAPSSGGTAPTVVNPGGFIKPAAGVYSSHFRTPERRDHHGVDIAASGKVPVVAAAAGVVMNSYYSSSYGNVIFITHRIKGQTYTTVYAHLRDRNVSTGQVVQQGQYLGLMGNTGQSRGQHLHFEIHVGGWNQSKSNAVNPIPFL